MSERPRRFPKSVYGRGEDPDPRFSLANERTFLTWITAGLALLSAGMALNALLPQLDSVYLRPAELLLIVSGIACPVQAWVGWVRVEAALRENRPLPSPFFAPWLAISLTAVGLLLLAAVWGQ